MPDAFLGTAQGVREGGTVPLGELLVVEFVEGRGQGAAEPLVLLAVRAHDAPGDGVVDLDPAVGVERGSATHEGLYSHSED